MSQMSLPDPRLASILANLQSKALNPESGIQPITGALLALIRAFIEYSTDERGEAETRAAFEQALSAAGIFRKSWWPPQD